MTDQPEALRLADALDEYAAQFGGHSNAAAELRRLHEENARLKTVMVAAAEEIDAHWDAHCDSDGYGPVNLMHRLENGIPSKYGYTAGEFSRLRTRNAELVEALHHISLCSQSSMSSQRQCGEIARAALAKVEARDGS